jgi:HD-like signal output (HDOD) protein
MAIRYLGLERVRSMAATSALRSQIRSGPRHDYLSSVWAHSIATAVAAEALGDSCGMPGLYTLGLTHDLGRLGLFLVSGQSYAAELTREFSDVEEANDIERRLFGMTHCEAGALVARVWRFPEALAACMGEHHERGPIATACLMADSLGFPEVPLAAPPPWPISVEQFPQLEPEPLWDAITARITELGQGLARQ